MPWVYPFLDRSQAGQILAAHLEHYAHRPDLIVLALPRGGVPVGVEVASHLEAPLDVFLVRKLGVPGHEELAMGALASGGTQVLNDEIINSLGIPSEQIDQVAASERQELARRERDYRGKCPRPKIAGKTVILVDDGLATGSSMKAATIALRQQHPARIVVAVPTAAPETCQALRAVADEVVCVITPKPFRAVGLWYENFPQLTDQQVRDLLARFAQPETSLATAGRIEAKKPTHPTGV